MLYVLSVICCVLSVVLCARVCVRACVFLCVVSLSQLSSRDLCYTRDKNDINKTITVEWIIRYSLACGVPEKTLSTEIAILW